METETVMNLTGLIDSRSDVVIPGAWIRGDNWPGCRIFVSPGRPSARYSVTRVLQRRFVLVLHRWAMTPFRCSWSVL